MPSAHTLEVRRWVAVAIATALIISGAVIFASARASAAASVSTIWGNAAPKDVALDDDHRAVELGTTFTPAVNGSATAIRFYKVDGVTGEHTGTLWTSEGEKLATATFTDETAAGWQTASLSSPIALRAGDTYVVSYSVPEGGRYAATVDFAGESQSASLEVPWTKSGVYTYGARSPQPTATWRSSQYWADVTFAPASDAGTQPTVTPTPRPTTSTAPRPVPSKTPTATPTPTPTVTPTATPTPTPTQTSQPPVSPSPAPTTPVSAGGFPTRDSAGLPAGWAPKQQVSGDLWIRQAGQVVEDLRITNGTIYVAAPNVTLRRIEGVGSKVNNAPGSSCNNGLLIEDSEFTVTGRTSDRDDPVIQFGGYTANNVMIDGAPEGLRVGATDIGCGPVSVNHSYIGVVSPTVCNDWHGDGIQGYGGDKLTVRQSTIVMTTNNDCWGTAPFFYPKAQGNTSVDIDGLLVSGGGYPFRNGMSGPIQNLKVVDGSWAYGPVDVNCSAVTAWSAQVVKLDGAGQPVNVRPINCTGEGN